MTTARSFTSKAERRAEAVAIKFDGERVKPPHDRWELELHSVLAAPGAVLDHVMASVTVNEQGQITTVHQAAAIPVLRSLICDEDLGKFEALIVDKDRVIDLKTLWEAAVYLVQELSELPTGGPGTSPVGASPTSSTSPDA